MRIIALPSAGFLVFFLQIRSGWLPELRAKEFKKRRALQHGHIVVWSA